MIPPQMGSRRQGTGDEIKAANSQAQAAMSEMWNALEKYWPEAAKTRPPKTN